MNTIFAIVPDAGNKGKIIGYLYEKAECAEQGIVKKYMHQIKFWRDGENGYDIATNHILYRYPEHVQDIGEIRIVEHPAAFWVNVPLDDDNKERAVSIAKRALDIYLHKLDESANEEARRRFCCGSCGLTFDSNTKNTRQKAELGDYWATRLGYEAKCPHCGGYAHECTEPVPFEQSASKTKQASKLLLTMESEHLEVWNVGADVCVCYANCEVKDGAFLIGEFGIGKNFEEACEDYLAKIRGKTLVFHACTSRRKEVTV